LVPLAVMLAWLLNLAVQVCRRVPGVLGDLVDVAVRGVARAVIWCCRGTRCRPACFRRAWRRWSEYLPFHATLGFPVELMIGRLSGPRSRRGWRCRRLWLAVFGGLALWLWRRGLRSYGAVGA
jgi:ABC-2 type transport system permease protein